MSCYEEARGTITLPASEASSFRRDIALELRRIDERRDALALDIYKRIRAAKLSCRTAIEIYRAIEQTTEAQRISESDTESLYRRLVEYEGAPEGKLARPKKTKPAALRGKALKLSGPDWNIDIAGRSVAIRVHENNHALEHASADPLFKAVIRRLARITWTRGSGGEILSQDEYSKDAFTGPSAWLSYGPKAAPQKSDAARHFRR